MKNKYGMNQVVQNDLQQCINSFKRLKKGGIGIADECVEQTCKNALKYINELESKIEKSVEGATTKSAKNLATHFGETICSNCGVYLDEMMRIIREEDGDDAICDYQPKFCANCGAKFVLEKGRKRGQK